MEVSTGLAHESTAVCTSLPWLLQGRELRPVEGGLAQAGGQPAGVGRGAVPPAPTWARGYLLTMVVLALLQSLAEALAQGQVTLSGGAVQELLDLIGAGPQRLGGTTGRGLGWCSRQQGQLEIGTEVGTQKWVPKLGANYPSPQPQPRGPRQAE